DFGNTVWTSLCRKPHSAVDFAGVGAFGLWLMKYIRSRARIRARAHAHSRVMIDRVTEPGHPPSRGRGDLGRFDACRKAGKVPGHLGPSTVPRTVPLPITARRGGFTRSSL